MQFPRFRIGIRLILSFAILLSLMTLTSVLAVWRLTAFDGMTKYLVNDKLSKQQLAADWLNAVNLNGTRTTAIAKSDSLEVAEYFEKQLAEGDKAVRDIEQTVADMKKTADETSLIDEIALRRDDYLAVREQIFKLKAVGKTIEVEELVGTPLESSFGAYRAAIRSLLDFQKTQANAIARDTNDVYLHSVMLILTIGVVAVLSGIALAWHLTRSIVRPLRAAADMAESVASGDLTSNVEADRDDEIGELLHALQSMNESLSRMAREIRDGVHVIDDALADIAADNEKLSERTSGQTFSVRSIAMERVVGSIDRVTNLVAQIRTASANQSKELQQIGKAIGEIDATTLKNADLVDDAVRAVGSLQQQSRRLAEAVSIFKLDSAKAPEVGLETEESSECRVEVTGT